MTNKKTILVIEDTPEILTVISRTLKERYKVKVATDGHKGLDVLKHSLVRPDLILTDIVMPEMDGYEVCQRIKRSEFSDIPVIFLTALNNAEDEEKGLRLGAVDYIYKPISPAVLMARVSTHLELKQARDFLKVQNSILEQMVKRRTKELARSQEATIVAMGSLAEFRDPETGNHLRRTQHFVKALAEEMGTLPEYHEYLTEDRIEMLFKSAPLHDIGKVGVPDSILLKPGRLDNMEFETMKEHTLFGKSAIFETQKQLDSTNLFLHLAEEIAAFHHERWNGKGYPNGLKGFEIPLSARLMAVADVYDALVSVRCYKPEFSHDKAVEIIVSESGEHFDPDVVKVFKKVAAKFNEIKLCFKD